MLSMVKRAKLVSGKDMVEKHLDSALLKSFEELYGGFEELEEALLKIYLIVKKLREGVPLIKNMPSSGYTLDKECKKGLSILKGPVYSRTGTKLQQMERSYHTILELFEVLYNYGLNEQYRKFNHFYKSWTDRNKNVDAKSKEVMLNEILVALSYNSQGVFYKALKEDHALTKGKINDVEKYVQGALVFVQEGKDHLKALVNSWRIGLGNLEFLR